MNEVIGLVGRGAVQHLERDIFTITTAPYPFSIFSEYRLFISPRQGAVRIDGRASPDTSTESLHQGFADLLDKLTAIYGPPESKFVQILPMAAFWNRDTSEPFRHLVLSFAPQNIARAPNLSPLFLAYECVDVPDYAGAENNAAPASAKKTVKSEVPASTWAVIKSWSGSGIKETEVFSVNGAEWRVSWSSRNEARPGTGILQIYVKDDAGKLVSAAANKRGAGQTFPMFTRLRENTT